MSGSSWQTCAAFRARAAARVLLCATCVALLVAPTPAQALGPDANGDGHLGFDDASLVGTCLGVDPVATLRCASSDVDGDGDVDADDVDAVIVALANAGPPPDPDLNDDGVVNVRDVSLVSSCQGVAPGSDPRCAAADLDRDGDVDRADLSAVALHLRETGYPIAGQDVTAPGLVIVDPLPLALYGATPADVRGVVDDPAAVVEVNGVRATLVGRRFEARGVVLREGHNFLTATARDLAGNVGTASIQVSLDTTAPRIAIDVPAADATLTTRQVTVAGMISDIVSGTVNDEQASVSVNGLPARVSNRSFEIQDLLLVAGRNTIIAVARDRAGNESRAQIAVDVRTPERQQRIEILTGNGQTGPSATRLPEPLSVRVLDPDGRPIEGRVLEFTVLRGDGSLRAGSSSGRLVSLVSDQDGVASAEMVLGSRVGAGIHQVAVTSPGFVGEAVFCETAVVGPPTRIIAADGEMQEGLAGQPFPRPLVALVVDGGGNSIADLDVIFEVQQGGGAVDGLTSVVKRTDSDGRAAVVFTAGAQSGVRNQVASARFSGLTEQAAVFTASARPGGAATATSVSGVVLDPQQRPIPNALVQIVGTGLQTHADAEGRFQIPGAPVGALVLLVDGSTTTRSEIFPFLAFMLTALPGVDNTIGMPIFIPALDAASAVPVGGDQDALLHMSGVPGVEFTVFARSATRPDGQAYVGPMSLTQVPADKVPMPPPNGGAPRIVWTLQPAGLHFEPPIRVQLPNVDDLAPGQVIEVIQFDHDLEQFVSVGPARVTPDGAFIVSDAGFGITKSGWGGSPPPPPPKKCLASPPECQKCDESTGTFVPDTAKDDSACADVAQSETYKGVALSAKDSCKGVCKAGACSNTPEGFNISVALNTLKGAVDSIMGNCLGDPLKTTVQDCVKTKGFNAECNKNGTDCASAAPGSNTFTLTPKAFKVASCDALDSSTVHEIVHACGNFRHRKCKADGTVLGEISCTTADCKVCVDPDTDKSYGCEKACFPATGSNVGKAAACK